MGQITIDTLSLPDATAAHPYAQALNAHNGIQPYVWTLATGTLPPGLALLATGALIGTPNVAGTYSFTLKATDSTAPTAQSATQAYTSTSTLPSRSPPPLCLAHQRAFLTAPPFKPLTASPLFVRRRFRLSPSRPHAQRDRPNHRHSDQAGHLQHAHSGHGFDNTISPNLRPAP